MKTNKQNEIKLVICCILLKLVLVFTACSMQAITLSPECPITSPSINYEEYEEGHVTECYGALGDSEDIIPFCYSIYIGIWRGYGIAIFETLVWVVFPALNIGSQCKELKSSLSCENQGVASFCQKGAAFSLLLLL